jgi:hypothetical protein
MQMALDYEKEKLNSKSFGSRRWLNNTQLWLKTLVLMKKS